MSKNIIIQEGGVGKQLTVKKLRTDQVGGGHVTWIPEDEASLETKSITENGTYKASDDGKYGYSQVTVNVSGGSGSANPDGTPSSGGGTSSSGTSSPGGPGSGVVGTDPVSGNDVFVGVDSGGGIVTTPLPSSLEFVNNPTNMDYENGDPIDTSGAVVIAKNADGSTWTSDQYPDGHIPLDELSLSSQFADIEQTTGIKKKTSELVTNMDQPISTTNGGQKYRSAADGKMTMTTYSCTLVYSIPSVTGRRYVGLVSSSPSFTVTSSQQNSQDPDKWDSLEPEMHTFDYSVTIDGKTAYYSNNFSIVKYEGSIPDNTPYVRPDPNTLWSAIYGTTISDGGQEIIVTWNRPGDGKKVETSLNVNVNSESSSGGGTHF